MNITIGKNVSNANSAQEAMEIAGLNYGLHLEPMYIRGRKDVDGIPVIGKEVPNNFAVVREDNHVPIANVGNKYEIVQNSEVFGFCDGIVEQGLGKFKRAFATRNGARVFIQMDLGDIDMGGDNCKRQLTLRTSHDGSSKITGSMEVFRLVCSNGLRAWTKESTFSVKHTAGVRFRMAQAKKILGLADSFYRWFTAQADQLFTMKVSQDDAWKLIKTLVPAEDESDVTARITNQRQKIWEYFDHGKGNKGESRWDLYNGYVEWIDHWRSRNREDDVAVETNLMGSGAKMKGSAMETLLYETL